MNISIISVTLEI